MSKNTISQFSLARDLVKGHLGVSISLASDDLVQHFFTLVADQGNEELFKQAETLYQLLQKDNPRRSKRNILQKYYEEMCMTYHARKEEELVVTYAVA